MRLPYIGCSYIHSRCRKYQVSVGYLSEPLFSLTTTQLLLYSVKPCEFTKGRPSHQVFDNWHQETCGLPMTSLVYWLEVLDTFRCQRPKNFCSLLCLYKSNYGKMKDVLREKFRFFWKQNASHLSVSLSTYGTSGIRLLIVSESHRTGTQPYNTWQGVSNRHL